MRNLFAVVVCILLSACSFGAAQFALYNQAFEAQFVEGDKVFDRLGRAERVLRAQQFSRTPGIRPFDPNEASLYLRVGDPPLTGALRASLGALKDYNDALTALATGAAGSSARAELTNATTALSSSLTNLTGAAGLNSTTAIVEGLSGGISKVIPLLEVVGRAQGRMAFREQLVAAHPDMKDLFMTLRAGTDDIFEVVQLSLTQVGGLGLTEGLDMASLKELEEFRELLAGWVLLLDQTVLAMDKAVAAVAVQRSAPDLSDLISASVEIDILAEAIKTARN